MTLTDNYISEYLKKKLEPELIAEILTFNSVEVKAGDQVGTQGDRLEFIPLVIKGRIRTLRYDEKGKEVPIYDIGEAQSCILSITAAMRDVYGIEKATGAACAKAIEDTKLIMIPASKSEEWMSKYLSWRKFVINLYEDRLQELLEQHGEIRHQLYKIEAQNQNITDSIQYARRIQNAILPPQEHLDQALPEHFILFEPRDIVSGDYYWLHGYKIRGNSPEQDKNLVIVAAADCTGHGVPGAFMSMLGITLLNEIIPTLKEVKASEILNQLKNKLIKALRQAEHVDAPKDGMDIALCVFDFENKKMQYSGAYNPMYLLRNKELHHIKGDKMPIGIHLTNKPSFTNHEIDIFTGDVVYLFSDGYIDQFGGEHDRKFLSKRFKEVISDMSDKSMLEQKEVLKSKLNEWKGSREQVDDILVMGVRVQ